MVKEEGQTGVNSSPKHGWSVKRDLVRLIGNLCYKNEPNQHLVLPCTQYKECHTQLYIITLGSRERRNSCHTEHMQH
jgi:hypothetical protein